MYLGIALITCSFIYSILIAIVYFAKKRINSQETRIYSTLIVVNIINLIIELLCCYTVYNYDKMPFLTDIVNRLFLYIIFYWQTLFTLYIYVISFKKSYNDNLNFKTKLGKIFLVICFVIMVGLTFLPLEYFNENDIVYSYGDSTNLLYLIVVLYLTAWIVFYVKKQNKEKNKKYLPIVMFILIMGLALVVRAIDPGILIISPSFAFVTNLMYFTIENPDSKLMEEIKVAKKFSDDSNYEKSLFLFNMSQDIKRPINNINEGIDEIYNLNDIDLVKERLKQIEVDASNLCSIVNNVLDLSATDVKNIKVVDNKYNIKNLLKEIIVANKTKIEKQGVEFRFNIDKNIPEYLLGDSIKLKQIMNELIKNAIKHTKTGFISLDATCVNKMDLCRLLIYVEDSGAGIKVSDLDKIFNSNDINLDDDNLNLTEIKKMLNVIGGTIIANSEYNKGSKFTIVLDQKIDNEKMSEEYNLIDKYKDLITSDKKVLVVDDSEASIKIITKLSNALNVEIESVKSGKECLDKIRNKEKYDLILIDDDMPKLSGYDTLEKLKQIKNFNTKVVMLTNNLNLEFEESYKKHGFVDILIKPVNKSSLTKIYNDNLKDD